MNNEQEAAEAYATMNDSLVSMTGSGQVVIQRPRPMNKAEALRCAAWLVALAGDRERFNGILDAVLKT